jgi:hypothetical protein
MEIEKLEKISPKEAELKVPENTGIYFWFENKTNELVYIGYGTGEKGLYNRIILQEYNPNYIEYRESVHCSKDFFQLSHSIIKKEGRILKKGIDKSALRKKIGRAYNVKPGKETIEYIMQNLYLKFYEIDDIKQIKELKKNLIKEYNPKLNG